MTARLDTAAAPDFRRKARGRFLLTMQAPVDTLSITVTVLTTTRQRWTFSAPVLDSPALRAPANYRTAPVLDIVRITPGPGAAPTYVDVETSEMVEGVNYTPFIDRVEAA